MINRQTPVVHLLTLVGLLVQLNCEKFEYNVEYLQPYPAYLYGPEYTEEIRNTSGVGQN